MRGGSYGNHRGRLLLIDSLYSVTCYVTVCVMRSYTIHNAVRHAACECLLMCLIELQKKYQKHRRSSRVAFATAGVLCSCLTSAKPVVLL